jgi:hypothetical protein
MTESILRLPCATLELDRTGSGPQRVLDGRPVRAGTALEVLSCDQWLHYRGFYFRSANSFDLPMSGVSVADCDH